MYAPGCITNHVALTEAESAGCYYERPAYALQFKGLPSTPSLCLNRHEHGTSRGAAQPSAGPRHSRHQAGHAPPAAAATMPDIVLQQAEAQLGQLCREPVSIVRLLEVATLCPNADIRLCGNNITPHNTHAVLSRSCRYALVVLKKRISRCLTLRLSRPPTPLNPPPPPAACGTSLRPPTATACSSACPSSCFQRACLSFAPPSRASSAQ